MTQRKMKLTIILILSLLLIGCNDKDQNALENGNNDADLKTVRFEPHHDRTIEKMRRLNSDIGNTIEDGGNPALEPVELDKNYTDISANKESVYITNQLMKRNDILQARVVSTDDRIFVSVMLEPDFKLENKPTKKELSEFVKELVPNSDKSIIVYTDDTEWDKRKNNNARLR